MIRRLGRWRWTILAAALVVILPFAVGASFWVTGKITGPAPLPRTEGIGYWQAVAWALVFAVPLYVVCGVSIIRFLRGRR